MRLFRASYRDRKGKVREASRWYVEFRDHMHTPRRLAGFTDERATAALGRKLEKLVGFKKSRETLDVDLREWIETLDKRMMEKLTEIGLLDKSRAAACRPLLEHLDDFAQALRDGDRTDKHVKLTKNRVKALLEGCGLRFWSEIDAGKVEGYLAARRNGEENLSKRSCNYYLLALRSFCRWMVTHGYSDADIQKVIGGNVLRVLRDVWWD